jgi:isopenicillin N synthase-like dioxygenase
MQTDSVPMIDLSAFREADPENPSPEQKAVALELRQACEQVGFFYIKGHGCSKAILNEMNGAMNDLFNLSLETKLELEATKNPLYRGYNSLETGAHSCTPEEKGREKDRKESFTIGAEEKNSVSVSPMHGENQWPTQNLPDFEPTARKYWEQLTHPVATRLMQALALSLELPMNYFVQKSRKNPHPQMVLLRYPPVPESQSTDVATGCGAHTDCGFLTILTQDHPGLEVKHANGTWVSAPPIEDAFVVNLGDLTQFWTHGRYQSTEHRVRNPSSTNTRHSIPFFWTVDYDTVLEPIPFCEKGEGQEPLKHITSGEYILQKLGLMYLAAPKTNEKDDEKKEETAKTSEGRKLDDGGGDGGDDNDQEKPKTKQRTE